MTQEKIITLDEIAQELEVTTEEKNLLEQSNLDLLEKAKILLAKNRKSFVVNAALGMIRAFRKPVPIEQDAQNIAADITSKVLSKEKEPKQGSLLPLMGYLPSDMTRVSPFFPMSDQEKHGEREYLKNFVISSGNWGQVIYTGPKLSMFDEDIFIVLQGYLHLANPKGTKPTLHTTESGRTITIYDYRGAALPFLQMLGIDKPCKRDYERLKTSVNCLGDAVVKFSLSAGKTKRGNPKTKQFLKTPIFHLCGFDDDNKKLVIAFNPYFYEMYIAGTNTTTIELAERMKLKSPIAKALHRFILGQHKLDGKIPYHYMTLAAVTNMNVQQPDFEIRRSIKKGLKDLIEKGILANDIKTDPFLTGKEKNFVRLFRAKKKFVKPPMKIRETVHENS